MKTRWLLTFTVVFAYILSACSLFDGYITRNYETTSSEAVTSEVLTGETLPIAYLENTQQEEVVNSAAADNFGELENQVIKVYQNSNPSVVYIITSQGSGSGFVYDESGHIVTNNHVVAGDRTFEVVFSNGDRQRATLVGADLDSDLAVIKVNQLPDEVSPLPLADNDNVQVGQFVVAIGNPYGEQGSMSMGIVSGLGRSLPSQRDLSSGSTYSLPQVIQTDAPINPGNSGGPLLNLDGEVIGVNAAIASQTASNSGVGFSIPVKALKLVVPDLLQGKNHQYAYLGVSFDGEITLADQNQYDLSQIKGAYVLSVASNSPAAQAGLIAANPQTGRNGDLITSIDGIPVEDFGDLNSYLVFNTHAGQTVQLTVLRNGEQITAPLTLGVRP